MKNRKKLVITLIGVIVLGIGLFVYQTFIKKQLHFKENLTVEINGKFNPNSYISEVEHGSVKDVACQSKNLNIKKLGKYEVTYTYKNREYTTTIQVVDTQKPVFKGLDDLTVSLNTTPDLKAGVEVSDNSLEDIQYKIDDKNLDTSKEGTYEVTYVAKDSSGNKITVKRKVNVIKKIGSDKQSNEKVVYLTFDDGPSKSVTIPILDILKENNVKATFFVLGSNAERYPEIVKRAYQEGHYIANHSFTHVYANIYASPQNVLDEYNRTEIAIKNAIGNQNYNSRLFRFPGGTSGGKYANTKKDAVNLLNQNNVAHLDWNALTADAAGLENVDEMLKYVEKTIGNKNSVVILMHDTGIKKGTSELLPRLIQMLKEKGYVFENIYDLLE